MRLVDEIEAAFRETAGGNPTFNSMHAQSLVTNPYWPRIRAALLAGEEMAQSLTEHHEGCSIVCGICESVHRFRAATEGTDASAIGRAS